MNIQLNTQEFIELHLLVKKVNKTTFEIIAQSGKRSADQKAVINQLEKIYGKK